MNHNDIRALCDQFEPFTDSLVEYDEVKPFVLALRQLLQENEELKVPDPCSCCVGEPISGKPCICGGAGTKDAELQGFRELCLKLQQQMAGKDKALIYIAHHPMTFDMEYPFRTAPREDIIKDMQTKAKKGLDDGR